jgi:hypothetical protein
MHRGRQGGMRQNVSIMAESASLVSPNSNRLGTTAAYIRPATIRHGVSRPIPNRLAKRTRPCSMLRHFPQLPRHVIRHRPDLLHGALEVVSALAAKCILMNSGARPYRRVEVKRHCPINSVRTRRFREEATAGGTHERAEWLAGSRPAPTCQLHIARTHRAAGSNQWLFHEGAVAASSGP